MFGKKAGEGPTEDPGLDLSLTDFLMENADPAKGYIVRLFRVYKRPGQREQTAFLETWRDTMPEYEEIAEGHGPGEYRVNLIYTPPGKTRTATSRMVAIDPHWGGKDNPLNAPGAQAVGGSSPSDRRDMMQMFQMFLGTLVQFQQAAGKNGNNSGGVAGMIEMQKALGQSIVNNYTDQNKLVTEVIRSRLDMEEPEQGIDPNAPFVMQAFQWLMAAWGKYGPQILAAPGAAGKFMKGKAQGLQQIQYALDHPEQYEQLYTQFQSETGAPADKLDQFIHALGYPTPAELRAEASKQQDTPTPTNPA